jgi:hypothetical protein
MTFQVRRAVPLLLAAMVGTPAEAAAAGILVTLVMTVNMKTGCGPAKAEFVRALPGGSADEPFRIPRGYVLVVTGVDWLHGNAAPGFTRSLVLYVENIAEPSKRQPAFRSSIRLNSDGAGGAGERMNSGFRISSAARVPRCRAGSRGPAAAAGEPGSSRLPDAGERVTSNASRPSLAA